MIQKVAAIALYWVLFFIGLCAVAAGLLRLGLWDASAVALVVTVGIAMCVSGFRNAVRFTNELEGRKN
ncbi:MAG TPA: hypothetical protein VF450_17430 [Noviherbaspirillum sp.]